MMRACAALVAALALALGASGARPAADAGRQLADVQGARYRAGGSGGLCDSCIWLVKTVRCEATDPDAQAALISMVLSEVCDKLGGELASQCSQLVPQLVPVAVMMLGSYSAKELCADMDLCSAAAVRGTARAQPGQPSLAGSCSMCKYLARSAAEHPEAASEQACASLPAELQPQCSALAARQNGNSSHADPCAGACAAAVLEELLRARLQPLPRDALSGAAAVHAHIAQPNADMCDTCKLAVFEAAAILGNVETQKQILEYAKQMCTSFSTYHDQCLAYVELYGPLAFNMLVQYLTPQLCITLSYCPPVAAEAVVYVA